MSKEKSITIDSFLSRHVAQKDFQKFLITALGQAMRRNKILERYKRTTEETLKSIRIPGSIKKDTKYLPPSKPKKKRRKACSKNGCCKI